MVDSGLLAEGSVRGFLAGTHFNRCKKLHPVVALSLKTLHFQAFLKVYEQGEQKNGLYLNEVIEIIQRSSINPKTNGVSSTLTDFFDRYNHFSEETLRGRHGRTAQFALIYLRLIELYQHLERALRTSDVSLYNYATHEICALFFTFNHQNYARWLTRNHDNFINMETSHPGLLEEFECGALSIRRTAKNFSRSPIDLTLEQTINANAANRLTGITSFTNSITARQRWSETHTARTAIITNFLEFVQLVKFDENSESPYQSNVFSQQVKKFIEHVRGNINPFSDDINPEELFNLSSGKAASSETAEFLLNVLSIGKKQRDEFINHCVADRHRFNKPIKRNVVKTFATENAKREKSAKKISDDVDVERNVLGNVLCLAVERKINLLSVFSYPLMAVPHSLANSDGTMISNSQKGELNSLLMSGIDASASAPRDFEVEIIVGFYYLNSLPDSPIKYGSFANFLLDRLCQSLAFEIHLIFDKNGISSLKDLDVKKKVHEKPMKYTIRGPNQERNGTLSKNLTNAMFREELITFLINHWADNEETVSILGEKRIFLAYGNQCYLYSKDYEKKKIVSSLENNHIELETKMILHLQKTAASRILVKIGSSDTIIVYLLYHMQFWSTSRKIWIETGDIRRNTLQMISANQIFGHFSRVFINALPAWFVFSGCSYEPSFHGKGRKTCLKTLEKVSQFQISFGNIGSSSSISQDDIEILEEYTCQLYHINLKCVNEARVKMFESAYNAGIAKGKMQDLSKKGKIYFPIHSPFKAIFRQDSFSFKWNQ